MPRATLPISPVTDHTRDEIRERLLEAEGERIRAILLFGSRVAGRPRAKSDWDVAVVLGEPVADWVEERLRLAPLFHDCPFAVDLHVFGEVEWREDTSTPGTLPYTVARKGELLYDADGHTLPASA